MADATMDAVKNAMAWMTSTTDAIQQSQQAYLDPDKYFFDKISKATSKELAQRYLDSWFPIATLKARQFNASDAALMAIQNRYTLIKSEIVRHFTNGEPYTFGISATAGTMQNNAWISTALTLLAIGGVVYFAWMMFSGKGKGKLLKKVTSVFRKGEDDD